MISPFFTGLDFFTGLLSPWDNLHMASIADDLRREDRLRILALGSSERLELAYRLGDQDVESYAATHGVTETEARRVLRRQRRFGRYPSRCMDDR